MAQAALGYQPTNQAGQAGLNEPLTMRDRLEQVNLMLGQGATLDEIGAVMNPAAVPLPDPVDDNVGVLGELGYGARRAAEDLFSGAGHLAADQLGGETVGDILMSVGDMTGPSDAQEEAQQRQAEARNAAVERGDKSWARAFIDDVGDTITQTLPQIGVTIGSGTLTGAAGGSVFGPVGTVVGGTLGAFGSSMAMLYNQARSAAQDHGWDPEDPEVQNRILYTSAVQAAMDAVTPVKILGKLGPAGRQAAEKLVAQGIAKRGVKEFLIDGGIEGVTELGQYAAELIAFDKELASKLSDEDKSQLVPWLVQTHGREAALNFFGGLGAGGPLGGAAGASHQRAVNAARKHDVELLTKVADTAGVPAGKLEAAAKDPEQAAKLAEASRAILQAEKMRSTLAEYEAGTAPDSAQYAEARAAAARAAERADSVLDKFLPGLGGKTTAQIKADKVAAEKQRRLDIAAKAKDMGLAIGPDANIEDVDRYTSALAAASAARSEAQQRLAMASKPKRRIKAQASLKEAIDAESKAREDAHRNIEGKSPAEARKAVADWRRGEVDAQRRAPAIQRQREMNFDPNASPEEQAGRALDIMERYDPKTAEGSKGLRKEIASLRQRLDRAQSVEEMDNLQRQIVDKEERLGTPAPIYSAAEQVLSELPEEVVAASRQRRMEASEAGRDAQDAKASTAATPRPSTKAAAVNPEATPTGATATDQPAQGAPAGETDAGAAAQEIEASAPAPDLPEEPDRYFTRPEGTVDVPVAALKPKRARPGGIENAGKFMRQAYDGTMAPREPISVRAEPDGTYTVLDGNSTYANVAKAGWKNMPVRVMTDAEFNTRNAPKLVKGIKKDTGATIRTTAKDGRIKVYVSGSMIQRGAVIKAVKARAEKEGLNVDIAPSSERAPTSAPEATRAAPSPEVVTRDIAAGSIKLDEVAPARVAGVLNLWLQASMLAFPTPETLHAAGRKVDDEVQTVIEDAAADAEVDYRRGSVKTLERLRAKAVAKADPSKGETAGRITDVIRASVMPKTTRQADHFVGALRARYGYDNVLDEGWVETPAGYSDRKLLVRLPTGLIAEVQIVSPAMSEAKRAGGGHHLYEQYRVLDPASPEAQALLAQQRELYAAALAASDPSFTSALEASGNRAVQTSSDTQQRSNEPVSVASNGARTQSPVLETNRQPSALTPPAGNTAASPSQSANLNTSADPSAVYVIRDIAAIPADDKRRDGLSAGTRQYFWRDELDRLPGLSVSPEQADALVAQWGATDGYEHSIVIDENGEVIGAGHNGHDDAVAYSRAAWEAGSDPTRKLIFTHNHPRATVASLPDTALLVSNPGLAEIRIAGPDGMRQTIRRGPSAEVLKIGPFRTLLDAAREVGPKASERLYDLGVDADTAVAIYSRALLRALTDTNIIEVSAGNDPMVFSADETRVLQEIRADARQSLRNAIRDGLRPVDAGAVETAAGGTEQPGGVQPEGRQSPGNEGLSGDAGSTENLARATTSLRAGRENLSEFGIKPGKSYKTRRIAAALEARQRQKFGTIAKTDRSPEAKEKLSRWLAEEAALEIEISNNHGNSAVGWYSTKYQTALDVLGKLYPELGRDGDEAVQWTGFDSVQHARDFMTALVAISSNGEKVYTNWKKALTLYESARLTGTIDPTSVNNQRGVADRLNLQVLNELNATHRGNLRSYLLEKVKVSDVNAALRAQGKRTINGFTADTFLPRSATFFGSKLGNFYANLSGDNGYLTMDRWWSRTFNRLRGTLIPTPTPQGMNRVRGLIAEDQGIDPETLSDDQVLSEASEYRRSYKARGYKNGTPVEKASNTLWKAEVENLNDAPFGARDRGFMVETVAAAQAELKARGHDITVADLQAILWYYEKRLYAGLGTRPTPDISFEEVANRVVDDIQNGPGSAGPAGYDFLEGPDGDGYPARTAEQQRDYDEFRIGLPGEAPLAYGGAYALQPRVSAPTTGQQAGQGSGPDYEGASAVDGKPLPARSPLPGLPASSPGPNRRVAEAASRYLKSRGLPERRQAAYVKASPARGKRLADAFEAMPDDINAPGVREAYEALAAETEAQYQAAMDSGLQVSMITPEMGDPYPEGPKQALADIRNGHLWFFPTESGFGTLNEAAPDSPMLQPTKFKVGDHTMLVNDLFRVVHDFFGHGREGVGFGAAGEENTWQSHVRMFSPLAARAMTTETRGQNSWVNYGPHGEANRANPKDTIYADQKLGLLPEWASTMDVEDAPVAQGGLLDRFQKPLDRKVFEEPGWFIATGLREAAGDQNTPANVAANEKLRAELTAKGLPFKEVSGRYKGVDQGLSFLVQGDEATAQDIGKRYGQESVLTSRGLVYQDGSVNPAVPADTVVGDAAREADFYSELPDGEAFSMGLDFDTKLPPPGLYSARWHSKGGGALVDHVKKLGIKDGVPVDKLHLTIMSSTSDITGKVKPTPGPLRVVADGPIRQIENSLVQPVKAAGLQARHKAYLKAGAVSKYPEFRPHLTVKYNATPEDIEIASKAPPFKGAITLGPERLEPLKPNYSAPMASGGADALTGTVVDTSVPATKADRFTPEQVDAAKRARRKIDDPGSPVDVEAWQTLADGDIIHLLPVEMRRLAAAFGFGGMIDYIPPENRQWFADRVADSTFDDARSKMLTAKFPPPPAVASGGVTDSPAFKKWFEGSVVTDPDGRPTVVYHGTTATFEAFAPEKSGSVNTPAGSPIERGGLFFTSDPEYASSATLGLRGANVIPAYLSIRNPLDLTQPGFEAGVRKIMGTEAGGQLYDSAVWQAIRGGTPWELFDGADGVAFTEGLRQAGFDGARFDEPLRSEADPSPVWVALAPEQVKSAIGNRGTFDPTDPDIAHGGADALVWPAYMRGPNAPGGGAWTHALDIARRRGPAKGWWTRFETQVINQFAPIRELEMNVRGALGVGMDSAFKNAEIAVNDSGRNETLLFYGAGDIDEHGAYRPKAGTIGIKSMLDKLGAPQAILDWQSFMAARRAMDLKARGFDVPLTDTDIADGLSKQSPLVDEVAADWKRFNDANVDLLVRTGRISPKLATVLKNDAAYIPFYRVDERVDGSPDLFDNDAIAGAARVGNAGNSRKLANRDPGIKRMRGGDKLKLDSLVDNMIRNSQAIVAAAMRNNAANKSFDLLNEAGLAVVRPGRERSAATGRSIAVAKPTENALKMWRDGKEQWVIPTDAAAEPVFVALAGLEPQRLDGIMRFAAQIASFFRQGITLSPAFMVRNMIRGMVSTGVLTTGANLRVGNNVITGMVDSLRRGSGRQVFTASTGMGDFKFGGADVGLGQDDWMVEYGLAPHTMGSRWRDIVNRLEHVGTATELGDRIAAMNTMIANGVRHDEAAYQALTIVNYSRKGSNAVLRNMLPLIPFLNARIQGLARLGEGAVGKRGPLGRKQAAVQMAINGSLLMVASALLWGWNNSDKDRREKFEAEPLHRRLNYHILYLGDRKVLIPKAFEIGAIFSTIPEMAAEVLVNKDASELGAATVQTLLNTFSFNPLPAALLPAVEAAANYSFFTGNPVVGQRFEGMLPRERSDSYTPAIAQALGQTWLADWTGASPIMIDHLLSGYGGAPYAALAAASDIVAGDLGLLPNKPQGAFGDMPVLSKVAQNTFGSMVKFADADGSNRYVGEFYDLKTAITQVYRSAKAARQSGDEARYRAILDAVPGGGEGVTKAYRMVNRQGSKISDLNSKIRMIEGDKKMSPEAKRAALTPLVNERNRISEQVYKAIREFEAKAGRSFASAA